MNRKSMLTIGIAAAVWLAVLGGRYFRAGQVHRKSAGRARLL